ncbi:hypothetical protein OQY15_01140 [Pedobacter sp. MC2016-15]|uniref:hypothetical protein n=1 Tax=Pedobacter sp. MC2016-15 TaxID=2994473 RepID=UPI0022481B9E|nr:hypothetical protein [Pedobacter sp. MC2016-15]MCX2477672.1 hypothetical protein [Pedobacter sp. MC2016-15]
MMKLTMKLLVVAALCLFSKAHAQQKQLKVGQWMPNMVLHNVHNYSSNTYDLGEMNFKMTIIQLLSVRKPSCLSNYAQLEELQCTYKRDVQFLRITSETKAEVLSFLLRHPATGPSCIPLVTDEKLFSKVLVKGQCQYIWIDMQGKIIAFTNAAAVTEENINRALYNQPIILSTMQAINQKSTIN